MLRWLTLEAGPWPDHEHSFFQRLPAHVRISTYVFTHIILYYTYTAYVYYICMSVNDFVRTTKSLLHFRNALYNIAQNVLRIHTFLEWTTLPITVACFVDDIMWRQLAQLYPKVPDMFRNTLQGHDISGSFWTVADERVPRSGVPHPRSHCVTLTRISHSLRVNHFHLYSWIFALSAIRKCLCAFS